MMTPRTLLLFPLILIVGALFTTSTADAQPSKVQAGEIRMELEDEKIKDPYQKTKRDILGKLDTFTEQVQSLSFSKPPLFNDEELTFLAAIHLHCTLQKGVCTLIPFALFETDLVRATEQEKTTCPNLVRFWKQWIGADMEKRVGLNLKVMHYEKRNKYKTGLRPKLLRCSQTVNAMLSKSENKQEYLKERYTEREEKAKIAKTLRDYIVEIHKKIPNIYRETGVRK
jgi:hypothetical protein